MSALRERLQRLRSGAGPDPGPGLGPGLGSAEVPKSGEGTRSGSDSVPGAGSALGSSLAERLQRLDPVRRRARTCREPDEQALADELGAEIIAPGVLLLERRQALRHQHGRYRAVDCVGTLPTLCS